MFKAVLLLDKNPNFKLESDDPVEQSWLDRNMERVMDAFVQKAFSDECQFRGYHNIDMSKLTYQKYLEYGSLMNGDMQFYADLTGETLNPDSRLDRDTAYRTWMSLSSGMALTKSNLSSLADMAAYLYREYQKPKSWCDDYDRGLRIKPEISLRRG
jgi:hypothetical protein